jgi:2-iminobutanoate/2-iminopropanoate deaminase
MKQVISTDKAPGAVGPYSQAISTGTMVFVSGQLPMDPATGQIVEGIEQQTKMSLTNVKAILEAAGSSLDKVVKATVFITNMDDFPAVNKVYAEFFTKLPPARACVEVSKLPRGANVEIEAIALI